MKTLIGKVKAVFKRNAFLAFALLLVISLQAQEIDLKQEASNEFEKGNYPKAILLLKQAVAESPNDADIYYYLGYYTHYLYYDSRPLSGYDEKRSDEVLGYLNKAITLDPKYGNAYYFIGAEYGGRFREAMRRRNVKKMEDEIRAGREKGGYPDWLIEYGRNILRSCEPNAILFTGGDAEVNPIHYLQFIENYRTDVTLIPVALLERPWFVMLLKTGFKDILVPAPISWSEEQILDMHPYKWQTNKIKIPINKSNLKKYNISLQDSIMEWELEPNLSSNSRTYLSAGRAILADIIETNRWKRAIYFTLGCPRQFMAGLEMYMQLWGLVYRLLPVETEKFDLSLNPQKIGAVLLKSEHYHFFADVKEHNMPRASRLLNNYHGALFQLANHYAETGNTNRAKEILEKMETYMPETVFAVPTSFKRAIENLRSNLKVK